MNNLTKYLESKGYQWDVGYTGINREARVWKWPEVIGRYRADEHESPTEMLVKACKDAGIEWVS